MSNDVTPASSNDTRMDAFNILSYYLGNGAVDSKQAMVGNQTAAFGGVKSIKFERMTPAPAENTKKDDFSGIRYF